jgi:hypothetical protein
MEKEMDEGRKRTLGVIAAIFACRKLAALEGKPSPAREMAFRDSIDLAAEMMRRMDSRCFGLLRSRMGTCRKIDSRL